MRILVDRVNQEEGEQRADDLEKTVSAHIGGWDERCKADAEGQPSTMARL